MESEGEGSSSDGGSSGQGSAEGQQWEQQQQGAPGPAAAELTEGSQQNGSERGAGEVAAAAASGESGPGGSTPGGRDSGDRGESAADGGQGDEDDAKEVAALLREENLEALADEEREKLTQARGQRHWLGPGVAAVGLVAGSSRSLASSLVLDS